MWDCQNCGQKSIISTVCPVCFKEPGMPRVTSGGYSDQTVPVEPEDEKTELTPQELAGARRQIARDEAKAEEGVQSDHTSEVPGPAVKKPTKYEPAHKAGR